MAKETIVTSFIISLIVTILIFLLVWATRNDMNYVPPANQDKVWCENNGGRFFNNPSRFGTDNCIFPPNK